MGRARPRRFRLLDGRLALGCRLPVKYGLRLLTYPLSRSRIVCLFSYSARLIIIAHSTFGIWLVLSSL